MRQLSAVSPFKRTDRRCWIFVKGESGRSQELRYFGKTILRSRLIIHMPASNSRLNLRSRRIAKPYLGQRIAAKRSTRSLTVSLCELSASWRENPKPYQGVFTDTAINPAQKSLHRAPKDTCPHLRPVGIDESRLSLEQPAAPRSARPGMRPWQLAV